MFEAHHIVRDLYMHMSKFSLGWLLLFRGL